MALIADILLIAGALGAAFYCYMLSRRLSKLTSLEDGVGGAISGLSSKVTDMTRTLERAQAEARVSAAALEDSTRRAEAATRKLELMMASLHDLPGEAAAAARNSVEGAGAAPSQPSETADDGAQAPAEPTPEDTAAPAAPTFRRRRPRSSFEEAAE